MFTGIVEEIGKIISITRSDRNSVVKIKACKVLEGTSVGDSISVNGVCLTVTSMQEDYFTADIMEETFRKSSFKSLMVGDKVNLERALTLSSRLGGHIVTGHIDGIGVIQEMYKEGIATWITISADDSIISHIVNKGSIAIDGISLTVAYVNDECFKVSIIPHTALETTLLRKKIDECVNLECDIVSKYVEKLLVNKQKNKKGIDANFLMENGFY